MGSSEPVPGAERPAHVAISRVIRLLSEVRLATLALALVVALVEGAAGGADLWVVLLALPFSVFPALTWDSSGAMLSRSGILLACDLVTTVLVVQALSGDIMTVYAAATVALLGVVVGARLALVMASAIAMVLVYVNAQDATGATWLVVTVGSLGVMAMAWAGAALGRSLRAHDVAAHEAALAQVRRAATLERVRIARDLHDTAAGDLAGATMLSGTLLARLTSEGVSERTIALARQLDEACRAAHLDTRTALGELRRAGAQPVDDLTEACERWSRDVGTPVALDVDPRYGDVDTDVAADVRAMVLELLENVRRHADARRVEVTVRVADGELTLTVTDDGRGMAAAPPLDALVADGHFGLQGMDERAHGRGGRVVRETPPGGGLRTRVTLALAPDVVEVR
ncbi:sensor histidine kinase [Cellulomonas sp. KH9]|uniref:sensor histidine kinase n=1 Tax=Cellulomonas sp. KH9 TaxID=1855324 RepID=UPI0008ECDC90|nr:ATP-binding protein [Cellulomonas sp. KH9]SFJ82125.1 Signal transduction histidine kinase [Cellulomonas sp. KH9]